VIGGSNKLLQASADRIKSELPSYDSKNVHITHVGCNLANNDVSMEQFQEWLQVVRGQKSEKAETAGVLYLSLAFDLGNSAGDPGLALHASSERYGVEMAGPLAAPVSYNSLDPRSSALAHYAAHHAAFFRTAAIAISDRACAPALALFSQAQQHERPSYDLPVSGAAQFLCDHPELHGDREKQ
jgi:hypothetical protein